MNEQPVENECLQDSTGEERVHNVFLRVPFSLRAKIDMHLSRHFARTGERLSLNQFAQDCMRAAIDDHDALRASTGEAA